MSSSSGSEDMNDPETEKQSDIIFPCPEYSEGFSTDSIYNFDVSSSNTDWNDSESSSDDSSSEEDPIKIYTSPDAVEIGVRSKQTLTKVIDEEDQTVSDTETWILSNSYKQQTPDKDIENESDIPHTSKNDRLGFSYPSRKVSSSVPGSMLPGRSLVPFLTPLGIPYDAPAGEVIDMCKDFVVEGKVESLYLGFGNSPCPSLPAKPTMLLTKELNPPTPTVHITNKEEALSSDLFAICLKPENPLLVMKGMAAALDIDLKVFSTKVIVATNASAQVEVRKQNSQLTADNWDKEGKQKTWFYRSDRSTTVTLAQFAKYQESNYRNASQNPSCSSWTSNEENISPSNTKQFATVQLGTNIDVSDPQVWKSQLDELSKLPWWFSLGNDGNMLNHAGYTIYGINTPQMYMAVRGCRFPGQQENNNLQLLHINIGPGDCEWFVTPEEYWGEIYKLCRKNGLDYSSGLWWPILQELYDANIPVYRFLQKPGDLIWLNAGVVHWIQSLGWCNTVAWNVGAVTAHQYQIAMERYEWNKFVGIKSLVPLMGLTWKMAKKLNIEDERLFKMMKTCMMRDFWKCHQINARMNNQNIAIRYHGTVSGEPAHYCDKCMVEVFNILFTCQAKNKKTHLVYCMSCAIAISESLSGFVVLSQYTTEELTARYDQFVSNPNTQSAVKRDDVERQEELSSDDTDPMKWLLEDIARY